MTPASLATDFGHQLQIAKELEGLSNELCHGTIFADDKFTLKDTIFFGLADKNFATFRSIRVLLEIELADDGFALIRVLAECAVNAVYICFSDGDEAAEDYRDFPAYFEWVTHQDLVATNPNAAKYVSAEEVGAMKKLYDAYESRFRARRDWCKVPLFQRAKDIDEKVGWSLLRTVVNSAWRRASAYVHGSADSITSRVKENEGGIVIQRQVRPQELGAAMYGANLIMFALLAFVDLRLGKRHRDEWNALHQRWKG